MIRWAIFICAARVVAYPLRNAPLGLKPTHLTGCRSCSTRRCAGGTRLSMRLSNAEEAPLRPETKLSGVVDDSIAIAALLAVAVLWGTNFPAVRYLVTDPVSLTPAAYSFARFGASALALSPLLPRASSKGALLAGAECGLWIAAGYVVQCLALQGTTAAKGALLAALQVVVVPAVVVLFPALRPKAGKQPTMKDWVCAGAALAGVALLELQGLTAPVASDAVAALQPVFFGISYLRIV